MKRLNYYQQEVSDSYLLISEMYHELGLIEGPFILTLEQYQEILKDGDYDAFVEIYDDQVVATMVSREFKSLTTAETKIYIEALYVKPNYRNLGYGTKLLNSIKNEIFIEVGYTNDQVLDFYLKNKFKPSIGWATLKRASI